MNRIAWRRSFPIAAMALVALVAGCKSPLFQTADRKPANDRFGDRNSDRFADDRRGRSSLVADRLGRTPMRNRQQTRVILARAMRDESDGRLTQAKAGYELVLQKDRSNTAAHHRLAVIADKAHDFRTANYHYVAALRAGSPSADLLNDYGMSLKLQDRPGDAEYYFKQALRTEPNHSQANNNLQALYAERDTDLRGGRSIPVSYRSRDDSLHAPSPYARDRNAGLTSRRDDRGLAADRSRQAAYDRYRDTRSYDRNTRDTTRRSDRYTAFVPDRRRTSPDDRLDRRSDGTGRGLPSNAYDDRRAPADDYSRGRSAADSRDRSYDRRTGDPKRPIAPSSRDSLAFPPRDNRANSQSYDDRTASRSQRPDDLSRDALRHGHNAGMGDMPFSMPPDDRRDRNGTSYRQRPADLPAAYDGGQNRRMSPRYGDRSSGYGRSELRDSRDRYRDDTRDSDVSIQPATKKLSSEPVPGQWNMDRDNAPFGSRPRD